MKANTIYFILSLCWLMALPLAAQDLEQMKNLFAQTEQYYQNAEQYSLSVSYEFFEDQNPQQAVESLSGRILKKAGNYYSKIGPTEFVYIGQSFLKINHQQKAVLYSALAEEKALTPVELTSLIEHFEKAELRETSNSLICELKFKTNKIIPYEKMLIFLDPNSYAIQKQELHLLPGRSYPGQANRSKTVAGKLVIEFTPDLVQNTDTDLFVLSNYLRLGDEISLAKPFSSYQFYQSN